MKKLLSLSVFVLMLISYSICANAQEAEMVEVETSNKGMKVIDIIVLVR